MIKLIEMNESVRPQTPEAMLIHKMVSHANQPTSLLFITLTSEKVLKYTAVRIKTP